MAGVPAGAFGARALDFFGRMTFASGTTVRDGSTAEPARLWAKVDLDAPDSREVMGFVALGEWRAGREGSGLHAKQLQLPQVRAAG